MPLPPHVSLRPAVPEDTNRAHAIHDAAFYDVVTRQFGPWDDAIEAGFFYESWNQPGFQIILYAGQPCGYVRIEDQPHAVMVHELVILPDFQGRGIGSSLLAAAQAQATKRGVPVNLDVLKANHAIRLYRRLGFTQVGENDTHLHLSWRPHPAPGQPDPVANPS